MYFLKKKVVKYQVDQVCAHFALFLTNINNSMFNLDLLSLSVSSSGPIVSWSSALCLSSMRSGLCSVVSLPQCLPVYTALQLEEIF